MADRQNPDGQGNPGGQGNSGGQGTDKMSGKPTTTDAEIAHGQQMAADMTRNDDRDPAEVKASNDPAPTYKADASRDPPAYDLVEATKAPVYDHQLSFEEWMRNDHSDL
ncbi:hypothetical protein F4808DRAFT_424866 [Astrocystis sublimbata]|nr:hypothetical protein F4808DRAFT_424866 [Astrocystis sublimbata]